MAKRNLKNAPAPKPVASKKTRRRASDAQPQPVVALVEALDENEEADSKPKTKKAKAAKVPKAEAPREKCVCGCGDLAKPNRFFLPGHDARLKGQFLKRMRGDEKIKLSKEFATQWRNLGFMQKNAEWSAWAEKNL